LRLVVALALVAVALAVSGAVVLGATDDDHLYTAKPSLHLPVRLPPLKLRGQAPAHVAVIVMENHGYGSIIGSAQAPFINRLARHYALASDMYATGHPSLPNYLALTAGSTFGVDSDCTGCSVRASNLATQLQNAGIDWKAYMEGLPHPCFTGGGAGVYAKKHDPFVYFTSVAANRSLCGNVVPLDRLASDEAAGSLPRFIWITPNLCHDMHDCSVARGDRFLAGLVPQLLASLGTNGVLVLTWDEGASDSGCCRSAHGGHIAAIVAGPGAVPGARLRTPTDQYSVLGAVEELLGLPRLRYAACRCTPSLKPLLAGPPS
jgi:phosphatidylinositol-3-phosphatase